MMISVGKVFVINKANKLLILRRSETAPRRALEWDLPGGIIEDGEDALDACIRETIEEAGLSLIAPKIYLDFLEDYNGTPVQRFYAHAFTDNDAVTLSYEHDMFKWVSFAEYEHHMHYQPLVDAFLELKKQNIT